MSHFLGMRCDRCGESLENLDGWDDDSSKVLETDFLDSGWEYVGIDDVMLCAGCLKVQKVLAEPVLARLVVDRKGESGRTRTWGLSPGKVGVG